MQSMRRVRVLVIGQTPPPTHGQGIMIETLLRGPMPRVELRHVRMAYSERLVDVGKVRLGKLAHLASVLGRTLRACATFKPDVIYYPPAGPDLVPALRDALTLLVIRRFAPRLVLHFHAGGLSELCERMRPAALRVLVRRGLSGADAAVMLSAHNPPDGQYFAARRIYYVPYGIADQRDRFASGADPARAPQVLHAGYVRESKGVLDLTRAAAILWHRGRKFSLAFMGSCSAAVAESIRKIAGKHAGSVSLLGEQLGDAKWQVYADSDVFCFPTFYRAETFGLVCVEAMMFGLPVIATRWRGAQDIVEESRTGFLVPINDPEGLASRLEELLGDTPLRCAMGEAGRKRYLERYTLERYLADMEQVFCDVTADRVAVG